MDDNKAFAIFITSACICGAVIVSVTFYSEGKVKEKEIKLKIEQEKTKQLNYEGADTTTWDN